MYKLFVALRYLRANKVIYFSIAGVALGIMVMIIVTSVMGGFSRDIQARIRGLQSHLVIRPAWQDLFVGDYETLVRQLRDIPHVTGAAPRIEYIGWLGFRGVHRDVMLIGIDPKDEEKTSQLAGFFARGHKEKFDFAYDDGVLPEHPGLVVGSEIYDYEGANVVLQTAKQDQQPVYLRGDFTIVGTFKSGMAEYDSKYVFMDLGAMQQFLKLDRVVNVIAIAVEDYARNGAEARRAVVNALHDRFRCRTPSTHEVGMCGRFRVRTWEQERSVLLQAVAIERGIQIIILFCIVIVAGFNIVAIYTMMVRAKTRDVGILRSLGATRGGVTLIFLISGGLCGLFGSIFGIAGGTLIATYLNEIVGFVRITSRELNRLAWDGPAYAPGVLGLSLAFYAHGFAALIGSWLSLYKAWRPRYGLWAGLTALLVGAGSLLFYGWAGSYAARDFDDPDLSPGLAWLIAGIAAGAPLAWALVRMATERWRELFFGGFVRIMGTVLYSAYAIFVVGAAAVAAALLATRPPSTFSGWDLFPRQVYYLDRVPVLIDPTTVVGIVLATLFVSLVFSIYPALRAASYNPIEAIRDE